MLQVPAASEASSCCLLLQLALWTTLYSLAEYLLTLGSFCIRQVKHHIRWKLLICHTSTYRNDFMFEPLYALITLYCYVYGGITRTHTHARVRARGKKSVPILTEIVFLQQRLGASGLLLEKTLKIWGENWFPVWDIDGKVDGAPAQGFFPEPTPIAGDLSCSPGTTPTIVSANENSIWPHGDAPPPPQNEGRGAAGLQNICPALPNRIKEAAVMHQIRAMSSCFLGNLHRLDEEKLSKMGQMVKKKNSGSEHVSWCHQGILKTASIYERLSERGNNTI